MLTTNQIKAIFSASPTASLITLPNAPDFTIVYANDIYLGITNRRLEEIIGKNLFDVFPENPEEVNHSRPEKLINSLNHALHKKKAHKIQLYRYDIKKKDSAEFETRFWNNDTYPLLDENDEVMYLVINPLDITEKVIITKESSSRGSKLLTKKGLTHPLFKELKDAICVLDLNGGFISFNKVLPELAECTPDILLQSSIKSLIAPEDKDRVLDNFSLALCGEVQNFEHAVLTMKGNHRIVNVTMVPIIVKKETIGVYTMVKDITSLKDAEWRLLKYNQQISNILESITDGFLSVDQNWTITYWNQEAEKIMSTPREAIVGKNLWESFPSAISLKFFEENHKAMSEKITVRYKEYYPALSIWLEVTAYPTNDGLSLYFQDITKRVAIEEQLWEAKKNYKQLFNLNPIPNWVYDDETHAFLNVNQAAIDHYGYSREEFLAMTAQEIRPLEDVEEFNQIHRDKYKYDNRFKCLTRHKKKSGEIIFVEVSVQPIIFNSKKANVVVVVDVTEKLKAEQGLTESIERLNIVLKATSDVIYDWQMATNGLTWNNILSKTFGLAGSDVDTHYKWWQHVHPDDQERVMENFNSHINNRKSKIMHEYRFRTADGSYKFVLDRSYVIYNRNNEPIRMIGAVQDFTEKVNYVRKIEAQNKKLSDITWTQCHIVRAPLSRILGLAELLTYDEQDLEKLELLSHLSHSAVQLDNIIKDIIKKTETLE